jgi:hypothetical protein
MFFVKEYSSSVNMTIQSDGQYTVIFNKNYISVIKMDGKSNYTTDQTI